MKQTLDEQLLEWHKTGKHQQIVNIAQKLPPQELTYSIKGRWACALNNLEQYAPALQLLRAMASSGARDPIYHYRMGYALFYLKRYREAEKSFREAIRLDPEDWDCLWFLATLYRNHLNLEREYRQVTARLKELDPQAYTRYFDDPRTYAWDDSDQEFQEDIRYARLWKSLSSPVLKKFKEQELDWQALPESEREIAALALLETDMGRNGFFNFYLNWGMNGYRYVRRGLANISTKKSYPEIEHMYARLWRSIEICYTLLAPHKEELDPHKEELGPHKEELVLTKEEQETLRTREATFRRNVEALDCKAWLYYRGEQTFVSFQSFDSSYIAIAEMANDSYYPAFLVTEIQALLKELADRLGKGSHLYKDIEAMVESTIEKIYALLPVFQQNGSALDPAAWESISNSMAYIFRWFDIDLPIDIPNH